MNTIDWHLVLEFAKALAAPLATVAVALIVSVLGFRTFRRQKALERRLGWYEQAYELMNRAASAFAVASLSGPASTTEGRLRFDEAMATSTALVDHLARSWLYADQRAHQAVADLSEKFEAVHLNVLQLNRVSGTDAQAFANDCYATSLIIAEGIRQDLGVPQLRSPA